MLKAYLAEVRRKVDEALDRYLLEPGGFGGRLHEAMRYSIFSGGKRLRPALCLMISESLGGDESETLPACCALEMVHTYSLIHDDLPAMDDDDYRRGRLSCHKAFDEATAILAGDGLLTQAFEVLACRTPSSDLVPRLIAALGEAAGPAGMVLGQMRDLEAEGARPELERVRSIHLTKTAAMISAAFRMGAICARATQNTVDRMGNAGSRIGLAFQIIDDLLDIEGTSESLGKTPGKDQDGGKLTYPAALGLEGARQAAKQETELGLELLVPFEQFARLRELALYMLQRTY